MRWVPNTLTALRIVLLPLFLYLVSRVPQDGPARLDWSPERGWAVLVLLVMGLTDFLDGRAARRFGAVTRSGSIMDALADRMVILVPLFYLALWSPAGVSPVGLWIPLWLLALDLLAGAAWIRARLLPGANPPADHTMAGRVGIWILFTLIIWVVLGLPPTGVTILGVAGVTLASVSAATHIRRWWGPTPLDAGSGAN